MAISIGRSLPSYRLLPAVAAVMLFAGVAAASPILYLGPADAIAVDQPRVTFGLALPSAPDVLVGPDFFNQALLDTGANGVLLGALAYFDFNSGSFNPNMYQRAQRPDSSFVVYNEIGVAGIQPVDILVPHNLHFAGTSGPEYALPAINIMGAPEGDFGSFAAIVGMPAMMGRTVHIDLRPPVNLEHQRVFFDASPPATPYSYHVPLRMLPPEHTGQVQPGDPLPEFAPLPLIDNVRTMVGGVSVTDEYVLDTGGQLTMISEQVALAMGIDIENPLDWLPVGGLGGETLIPIVAVDRMIVPTTEGVDLVFDDLIVGVIDIPGIGGVFGMNMVTSGYLELLGQGGNEYGLFGDLVLDFTGESGIMRLDTNPAHHRLLIPGDSNGDGRVDGEDFLIWQANFGMQSGASPLEGDFNFDGRVDGEDFLIWQANFGQILESAAAVTPEPAGPLALLALGALAMRRRRHRSPRAAAAL